MKIYLIGYMGSGKSALGALLAQQLQLPFVDMDKVFEGQQKTSVSVFFKEQGEKKFRELERQILQSIAIGNDAVIACGGGTPCFFDNMEVINSSGISIYLKVDAATLLNRLDSDVQNRPLFANMKGSDRQQKMEKHLAEREVYYLQAKIVFDTTGLLKGEVVAGLLQAIRTFLV